MDHQIHQTKFFKNPDNPNSNLIQDCLIGQCVLHHNLYFYKDFNIVVDKNQLLTNNVKVICGGGSGHEPSHSGYVCEGMLSAAVCGDIFSSPTYKQILNSMRVLTEQKYSRCFISY